MQPAMRHEKAMHLLGMLPRFLQLREFGLEKVRRAAARQQRELSDQFAVLLNSTQIFGKQAISVQTGIRHHGF